MKKLVRAGSLVVFPLLVCTLHCRLMEASPTQSKAARQRPTSELKILGGAIVEKKSLAKTATAVTITHGVLSVISPTAILTTYGYEVTPISRLMMRRIGLCHLNIGLLGYSCFFQPMHINQVVGLNCAAWVLEFIRSILNKDTESCGGKVGSYYLLAAIECGSCMAFLSSSSALVIKAASAFALVLGLFAVLSPTRLLESWQLPTGNANDVAIAADLALWLFVCRVYTAALAWELDAIQALVCCQIVILLRCVLINVGTNRTASLCTREPLQSFWIGYNFIITLALLI